MTEDEARTKWCPFAFAALSPSGPAVNRIVGDDRPPLPKAGTQCIASDCMMWRSVPGFPINGFCGLAGSPPRPSRRI